jgi:hypothetical protein
LDKACKVNLELAGRQLEEVLASMQVPFPELTDLQLWSDGETLQSFPIRSVDLPLLASHHGTDFPEQKILGSFPFVSLLLFFSTLEA